MSSTNEKKSEAPEVPAGKNRIDLSVLIPTAVIALAVVIWGAVATTSFENASAAAFGIVVDTVGWLFIVVTTAIVIYAIYLAFSRYGSVRLGRDDDRPEFSTGSWIAMMFAAGMGIGLMFYGVAEPLTHYNTAPPGKDQQYDVAMATTAFHWTLHPWSLYAIVGLALGLAAFRFGRSHLISQAFVPLIGEKRAKGWMGTVLDVAAVLATIFGTAASLGIGAVQIQSGLNETGAVDGGGVALVVGVIIVLGAVFLLSAASGVDKGIKILSNINLIMAGILALFVAIFSGAILFMLDLLPTTVGTYFTDFFAMASRTAVSDGEAAEWLSSWTVFYWAWWISWSPFVGMFLARISRGRTVRQFIIGVVLVPSTLSLVWFSIFGGFALYLEEMGRSIFGDGTLEPQLFNLLKELPLAPVLMVIAMLLIAIFFITSADSASIVMGGMAQYGAENPTRWVTMMMGTFTAAVAIIMLVAGDGGEGDTLSSLQNMTIIAASPFVLVLVALCVSIQKSLMREPTFAPA